MKRLLSLLGMLIVALSTFAQTFTVGDLTYYVTSTTDKTVRVSDGKNATGDVVVPETITYNDVEYSVTSIGAYAFSLNNNITSVSMLFVSSVRDYAFSGCENIEYALLPKTQYIGEGAFGMAYNDGWHSCSSLKTVDLSSVISIGIYGFQGASKISSLRIGSTEQWCNVDFQGMYACPIGSGVDIFIGESETPIKDLYIPNTVKSIPEEAFWGTSIKKVIAPSVTRIGKNAFYGCSLTYLDLSSVESIEVDAFRGSNFTGALRIGSVGQWCNVKFQDNPLEHYLGNFDENRITLYIGNSDIPTTDLVIPDDVEIIPSYAFSRVANITNISAPSTKIIGNSAFKGFDSIETISIPCVNRLGYDAFGGCNSIKSIHLGSIEQWCNVVIDNSPYFVIGNPLRYARDVNLYFGDSETPAASIEIPSTVAKIPDYAFCNTTITSVSGPAAASIGDCAFNNCTSLTSVSLPAATTIGSYAFQSCTSLTSVSLPTATSIGGSAFYDCTSLTSVNFPAATSIGSYAFGYCTSLTSVSLPAAASIGGSAFSGCNKLKSLSIPKVETIGSYAFRDTAIETLRIGSVEQYCSIEYGNTNVNNYNYTEQFPFQNDYNNCIFIGDSDTPVTEITIPETTKKIADYAFRGTGIHTVHFEGTNPPALVSTGSFPGWTMLAVPEEAYETYLAADVYKNTPLRITINGHLDQDVEVTAANGTSNLLEKIGEDDVKYVVNLKVSGTINSYDMLIIRNQMTSLRNLDLTDASIVDCDYIYSNTDGTNYHSQKDVITGDWLKNVMNVKLPTITKTIGYRAFYYNSRLQTVNIPDGVTSIGSEAFYYCNRIKELTLPQTVTSFGSDAFYSCTGLREVVIPDGVTSIGYQAFENCTDLKKVTIPASVKSIGERAFKNNTLELHISDLESWINIQMPSYSGSYYMPFTNVAKLYIGDSLEPTEDLVIPEGTTQIKNYAFAGFNCLKSVTFPEELNNIGISAFYGCYGITDLNFSNNISSIGSYAFSGCSGLKTVKLPEKLTTINSYAFQSCSNLETIEFADNVTSIGSYSFSECSKLTKLELPAYLKTIGSYAFEYCSNLTEVVIPASLTSIADYAFQGCYKMNTVIATTVEPIRINQNTFSTYTTATLYSPKTSYYKYYWNTQYNQFLSRKEYDKEFAKVFGYKYFYLNGQNGDNNEDFVISDETGPIQGVDDKAPDADFYEGAGLVVGGEQVQNLGDIHLHHNGNNGASIIAKGSGKVHIDNLYVDIKTQKNRWYFFCFPFDVNTEDATFDGSHVWYLYDGEARAQNGNGGWKKTAVDGVMAAGNGYIFQGAQNGTLTIHVSDLTIDTSDSKTNMITYASDNKNDASWNLIGNPSMAYYDMDNLGYDAPITVYDNNTGNYEAVRPGDDQYEFYPFQAFFVQKPEGVDALNFEADKKETKNMADKKKPAASGAKAKAKAIAMRKVINLEIVAADEANDTVAAPTDRTRIVVNPMKTTAYEPECDAAKFIADGMPQIYSLDNEGSKYAINERPVEDGIIALAVKAYKEGIYTISAPRLDCPAKLRDLDAETEVDLAEGGYTFMAEAKTYTNRFQLILGDNIATGITTPEEAQAAISVEAGAINIADSNADVKVYTVSGSLVALQKGAGTVSVPAGTYVVNVNGQSIKVNVNE